MQLLLLLISRISLVTHLCYYFPAKSLLQKEVRCNPPMKKERGKRKKRRRNVGFHLRMHETSSSSFERDTIFDHSFVPGVFTTEPT